MMDLGIVGIPRSGSTLLCELLHDPDSGNFMLYEPDRMLKPEGAIRWGCKQVWPSKVSALLRHKPAFLIKTIRNPWHAALSYMERVGPEHASHRVETLCASGGLMEGRQFDLVVRYEDLVENPQQVLLEIHHTTGWNFNLDGIGHYILSDKRLGGRAYEYKRHDGGITTASVRLRSDQLESLKNNDCRNLILETYKRPLAELSKSWGYE